MVATYERISDARLNLTKSTIVQLGDSPKSPWLRTTDYKVVDVNEVIIYLESPTGHRLSASKEMEFLLRKVRK